jgi:hypothetical protein
MKSTAQQELEALLVATPSDRGLLARCVTAALRPGATTEDRHLLAAKLFVSGLDPAEKTGLVLDALGLPFKRKTLGEDNPEIEFRVHGRDVAVHPSWPSTVVAFGDDGDEIDLGTYNDLALVHVVTEPTPSGEALTLEMPAWLAAIRRELMRGIAAAGLRVRDIGGDPLSDFAVTVDRSEYHVGVDHDGSLAHGEPGVTLVPAYQYDPILDPGFSSRNTWQRLFPGTECSTAAQVVSAISQHQASVNARISRSTPEAVLRHLDVLGFDFNTGFKRDRPEAPTTLPLDGRFHRDGKEYAHGATWLTFRPGADGLRALIVGTPFSIPHVARLSDVPASDQVILGEFDAAFALYQGLMRYLRPEKPLELGDS